MSQTKVSETNFTETESEPPRNSDTGETIYDEPTTPGMASDGGADAMSERRTGDGKEESLSDAPISVNQEPGVVSDKSPKYPACLTKTVIIAACLVILMLVSVTALAVAVTALVRVQGDAAVVTTVPLQGMAEVEDRLFALERELNTLKSHCTCTLPDGLTSRVEEELLAVQKELNTTAMNITELYTDLNSLSSNVSRLAATTVSQNDFALLSANLSGLDADIHRLLNTTVSLTDFNDLASNVTTIADTKVNQADFNELSTYVSIINASTVRRNEFDTLSAEVTNLAVTTVNKTDFHRLSNNVSRLAATTVSQTDFIHLSNDVSHLADTRVSKTDFNELTRVVNNHIDSSQSSFISLTSRVNHLSDTVDDISESNGHIQTSARQSISTYIPLSVCLTYIYITYIM